MKNERNLFQKCCHYREPLNEDHRHYINELKYNNCVLCVSEWCGPLTQDVISKYLGLSKMRICQIERIALKKMKKRIVKLTD